MNRTEFLGYVALLCLVAIAGYAGGAQSVKREIGDRVPVRPVNSDFYHLPKGHLIVCQDANGFYWTESMTLEQWTSCGTCHGKRWSQAGGTAVPQRLEFYEYKDKQPDGTYKTVNGPFPENPEFVSN